MPADLEPSLMVFCVIAWRRVGDHSGRPVDETGPTSSRIRGCLSCIDRGLWRLTSLAAEIRRSVSSTSRIRDATRATDGGVRLVAKS
jgi:hypothetical protein